MRVVYLRWIPVTSLIVKLQLLLHVQRQFFELAIPFYVKIALSENVIFLIKNDTLLTFLVLKSIIFYWETQYFLKNKVSHKMEVSVHKIIYVGVIVILNLLFKLVTNILLY